MKVSNISNEIQVCFCNIILLLLYKYIFYEYVTHYQDVLRDAFQPFHDDSDAIIIKSWDDLLKRIDGIVLEALSVAVKRTLNDVLFALVGDNKTELTPLFIVEAILSGFFLFVEDCVNVC
jgi:hypothetical protein